ncbi:MAG: class I SAM-dependent methyltransferase [Nitrospira sp.]|nr:class I SAM-dependent methyltransferase [Nitrospira sp.]
MSYTYDYTGKPTDEGTIRLSWRFLKMHLTRCLRDKIFRFNGKEYEYFYHPYNKTWKNERGIEIPIFREILLSHHGKRILEVGNVLSHYFPVRHDVVDKYEVSSGVINQDIIEFVPREKYDLIVSISTLEHVGWDEQPQAPPKLLRAIEHVRSTCLAPGGMLVASLPVGYNRYFDDLLDGGSSPFTTHHFLKRISKRNYWVEANWEEVRGASYGRFVAHAICIGIIQG